jgi:hypothetical protein
VVTVGDRTARVSHPVGGFVRRRVNWISLGDLVGAFLFHPLADRRGEVDAVAANSLPRNGFASASRPAVDPTEPPRHPSDMWSGTRNWTPAVRHGLGRK